MTLTAPASWQPQTNYGISPHSGGGLGDALLQTGITIAETVITNYLKNKFSGKTVQDTNVKRPNFGATRRNKGTYNRPRYGNYSRTRNARFGGWRKRPSRWKRYYSTGKKF